MRGAGGHVHVSAAVRHALQPRPRPRTRQVHHHRQLLGHGAALVLLKLSTECLALALQCRRYSEQTEPAESVFSLNAAVNVLSSDTNVTFCPCWHFQQFLLVGIFQLANLINFLARLITGECHCRGRCVSAWSGGQISFDCGLPDPD